MFGLSRNRGVECLTIYTDPEQTPQKKAARRAAEIRYRALVDAPSTSEAEFLACDDDVRALAVLNLSFICIGQDRAAIQKRQKMIEGIERDRPEMLRLIKVQSKKLLPISNDMLTARRMFQQRVLDARRIARLNPRVFAPSDWMKPDDLPPFATPSVKTLADRLAEIT